MTIDPLSLFSLHGRSIVVAGASRGIGLALAQGLASAGAIVTGFGRSAMSGEVPFAYHRCDLDDAAAVGTLLSSVDHRGPIRAYFHVAATTTPARSGLQSTEVFAQTLQSNLTNAYRCCAQVGEMMADREDGSIVTVTSIGSVLGFPNNPGYVAAKGGLRMMSKALALDLGQRGVRVNCLVPGYIHTEMTAASFADPQLHAQRADRTMLGRWGNVSDLVGAAVFLASDASQYVTGSDLFVDGGWTAKGL